MALRLYPFRQYSDHDVINMFANQIVDDSPSTDGAGSAGVLVKVLSGNLKKDVVEFASSSSYLGKTDYPFLGADKYPQVPLRCIAATTGAPVLGVTLNQTIKNDENGEKLIYNPIKRDELQAVLSGQAVPVATRGLFTFDQTAYTEGTSFIPGNVAVVSSTAGTMDGLAPELVNLHRVIGHIIATGNRTSQNGQADQFAGTGTANYAMVHIDASASWSIADNG
jgi:hypothetical protein